MRSGVPVGRLFHAPVSEKLTSDEIWTAIKENRLKLPNTISIDSHGSVFLTPHQVSYTLNPPAVNGFIRHTDKSTGVPGWWNPITVDWTFQYPSKAKAG